jgi:hypothetical protein
MAVLQHEWAFWRLSCQPHTVLQAMSKLQGLEVSRQPQLLSGLQPTCLVVNQTAAVDYAQRQARFPAVLPATATTQHSWACTTQKRKCHLGTDVVSAVLLLVWRGEVCVQKCLGAMLNDCESPFVHSWVRSCAPVRKLDAASVLMPHDA